MLLTDPNMKVYNNTIIGTVANLAKPLISNTAPAINTDIRGNLLVAAAGFSRGFIEGDSNVGVNDVTVKNNIIVNYSANSNVRFVSVVPTADLAGWNIDGNQYVQMPGSYANAWPYVGSWANWLLRAEHPDANSPTPITTLPVDIPVLGVVGAAFDTKHPYGLTQDNPMLGAGVECGIWRDAAGRQRPNPPSIGPVDVATLRRVLVTDPASPT